MKLSFDEEHRHAMNELGESHDKQLVYCFLTGLLFPDWFLTGSLVIDCVCLVVGLFVPAGGLQAVAELLQVDCEMFGLSSDHYSVTLRRYAGMALTNLTFGDVANKVGAKLKQYCLFVCFKCLNNSKPF